MRTSETIAELADALAKAQGEMEGVAKDGRNPHFNRTYATLASVLSAVRGPLSTHGLSVYQATSTADDGRAVVTTRLMHATGEWIENDLSARPVKDDPQGLGSALTYLRRYSLMAVCGVAPEDDDGQNASTPPTSSPTPARRRGGRGKAPADPLAPLNQAIANGVVSRPGVQAFCAEHFGCDNPRELTPEHRTQLLAWVDEQTREAA